MQAWPGLLWLAAAAVAYVLMLNATRLVRVSDVRRILGDVLGPRTREGAA
jgi:hypothetical protein